MKVHITPEEGWRIYQSKCHKNNKDKDSNCLRKIIWKIFFQLVWLNASNYKKKKKKWINLFKNQIEM